MDRPSQPAPADRAARARLLTALTCQQAAWSRLQQTHHDAASDPTVRAARRTAAEADFDAASNLVEELLAGVDGERQRPAAADEAAASTGG